MPTPTEVYDQIRNMAFDADVNLSSEAELYYYMSEAELEMAKLIPCTETTDTDNSVIDQREYDRPSDALKIQRVTWNTVKLKKIRLDDVDTIEGQSYGGIISTGNIVYFYEYGTKIGFSPLPNTVAEIKYWYLQYPPVLNASSSSFTIPQEYAIHIPDYCLYRMFLKDGLKGEADRSLAMWKENKRLDNEDWSERHAIDRIEQVQLEEIYPTSEMGMI